MKLRDLFIDNSLLADKNEKLRLLSTDEYLLFKEICLANPKSNEQREAFNKFFALLIDNGNFNNIFRFGPSDTKSIKKLLINDKLYDRVPIGCNKVLISRFENVNR